MILEYINVFISINIIFILINIIVINLYYYLDEQFYLKILSIICCYTEFYQ